MSVPRMSAVYAETLSAFGRIDGLLANAGRGGTGTPFVDGSLEEWQIMSLISTEFFNVA